MSSHVALATASAEYSALPVHLQCLDASIVVTATYIRHVVSGDVLQGEVQCEQPNASLYTFTGNLMLAPPVAPDQQTIPLSQASLLLRGSSLRNTKYVYGTVIFAGHESKVSWVAHLSC